jgi:hypothetical protein
MKEPEISVINGRMQTVKARSGCIAERHAIVLGTRGPVQRQEGFCMTVLALNSGFLFAHYTCDTTCKYVKRDLGLLVHLRSQLGDFLFLYQKRKVPEIDLIFPYG